MSVCGFFSLGCVDCCVLVTTTLSFLSLDFLLIKFVIWRGCLSVCTVIVATASPDICLSYIYYKKTTFIIFFHDMELLYKREYVPKDFQMKL